MPPIDWHKQGGLVPCVTQDANSGRVLMLAWMNPEALARTMETGKMHYWSRTRQKLWMKGEESGHTQELVALHVDCDGDTLLALVHQQGPACHTGKPTCWFTPVRDGPSLPLLDELWQTIADRRDRPKPGSWTTTLIQDEELLLSKIREEAAEVERAARGQEADDLPHEVADLLYHTMVLLASRGHDWHEVLGRLRNRRR